jgi:membrane glycosyltransferase
MTEYATSAMPSKAPLAMHAQDFRNAPTAQQITSAGSTVWRTGVFLPALAGTGALLYGMYGWLSGAGMTGLEWVLLGLIGVMIIWVTLSVSTVGIAVAGLRARAKSDDRPTGVAGLDVALLVPVYNEVP